MLAYYTPLAGLFSYSVEKYIELFAELYEFSHEFKKIITIYLQLVDAFCTALSGQIELD